MSRKLSGLSTQDILLGDGTEAVRGAEVTVRWRGFLRRGDMFQDITETRFKIGQRRVIAGLEKGVIGMRIGGKRQIRMSPHLAYGAKGAPGVPPNAVLLFEVELIEIA